MNSKIAYSLLSTVLICLTGHAQSVILNIDANVSGWPETPVGTPVTQLFVAGTYSCTLISPAESPDAEFSDYTAWPAGTPESNLRLVAYGIAYTDGTILAAHYLDSPVPGPVGTAFNATMDKTLYFTISSNSVLRFGLRTPNTCCSGGVSLLVRPSGTTNLGQTVSANTISFQGALTGANGQPLPNANYNLTFKFYDVLNENAMATSNVPNVTVTGGIASTAVPVDPVWFRRARYLGVAINGATELLPRIPVTAVPVAMYFRGPLIDMKGRNLAIGFDEALDPNGNWALQTEAFGNGNFGIIRREPGPVASKSFMITAQGNVGLGTQSPGAKLDVRGTARMYVCQITGGADLAEHLSVTDAKPGDEFKVEPGMVVSIDPSGNRKFKLSDEPYDRNRVGIISGGHGVQPGLVLRDEGNPQADGEQPIALTGQVWCHADTAFGPITPGDLLTTSSTPGHAMRVSDDAKARFAVLGQALTGLKEGRGWVQVLVGKQ